MVILRTAHYKKLEKRVTGIFNLEKMAYSLFKIPIIL